MRARFLSNLAELEPESICCSSQPFGHTALRPPTTVRVFPTRVKWKPLNCRLEKTGLFCDTYAMLRVWPIISIRGNVVATHLEISSPNGPQTLAGMTALHANDSRTSAL